GVRRTDGAAAGAGGGGGLGRGCALVAAGAGAGWDFGFGVHARSAVSTSALTAATCMDFALARPGPSGRRRSARGEFMEARETLPGALRLRQPPPAGVREAMLQPVGARSAASPAGCLPGDPERLAALWECSLLRSQRRHELPGPGPQMAADELLRFGRARARQSNVGKRDRFGTYRSRVLVHGRARRGQDDERS